MAIDVLTYEADLFHWNQPLLAVRLTQSVASIQQPADLKSQRWDGVARRFRIIDSAALENTVIGPQLHLASSVRDSTH
jgi:hypothetical protein